MVNLSSQKADLTLDMTGVSCPGPMLSAKRLSDDMSNGQVLLLISDCSSTEDDLHSWCELTQHNLLAVDELGNGRKGFYIRKAEPWPVTEIVDACGARCPEPVIAAARKMDHMAAGEVLKLVSNCPSAPVDVASWARATHHRLLESTSNPSGVYSFYIQK